MMMLYYTSPILFCVLTTTVSGFRAIENPLTSAPVHHPKLPSSLVLTWERGVEEMIRTHLEAATTAAESSSQECSSRRPFMMGVVGIPGSGKSTSCEILNTCLQDVGCLLMPADGYHHSKSELAEFPDPLDALYRRGAPDTFDALSCINDLQRIRQGKDDVVAVPGFDHAVGDPTPDAHIFERNRHHVVLCEGLYLLHDSHGWEAAKDLFDMTIFVQTDVDRAMERVAQRNLCIPGYTPDEIVARVQAVDRVNALMVDESKDRANMVVQSAASA